MIYLFRYHKEFKKKEYESFVIGADIGGTHTRIGFAGVKKKKSEILFSLNYPTAQSNPDNVLLHAIKYAKEKHEISPKKICLAIAGPITKKGDFCNMTNTKWKIDRKNLEKKTGIKILPLVNDMEAIGHGIQGVTQKEIITISKGNPEEKYPKTIIAAGTGLGKCTIYEDNIIPSELGNNDFPAQSHFEMQLCELIKRKKNITAPVQYEDVVSGPGMEYIYTFLNTKGLHTSITNEILKSEKKSQAITDNRKTDHLCAETFKYFIQYYARFAKNAAFNDLPKGGIYITGSIASNNHDAFGKNFMEEFLDSETHKEILKAIPIHILLDADINLKGACILASKK